MSDTLVPDSIRPIVVCVFRNGSKILVFEACDPCTGRRGFRPLGGGIEFGEYSADALRREMREELGAEIDDVQLLGVCENVFEFNGMPAHEIVFVYDAVFTDSSFYETDTVAARESNDSPFTARWLDLTSLGEDALQLYPDGLLELLQQHTRG